ncbi:hypothetical protein ATSB10_09600 [Dyella thiooxydans]|uniref:DUF2523 domain-containing protein n=1 Tax=Dyella thiooxydans TaxID=445710 RepID=A0A160MZ61_9GAMM|nr:DUF2523 family protein [Dyella thiooxydans]AND68414.1 hypothetical protein ATSB10_09600 [Dyella thiooxydans]
MPAVLAALGRMLTWLVSTYIGQWILKALLALGVGLVIHQIALPDLIAYVRSKSYGMGQFLFDSFGALGGDVGFTMILSATVSVATGRVLLKALAK